MQKLMLVSLIILLNLTLVFAQKGQFSIFNLSSQKIKFYYYNKNITLKIKSEKLGNYPIEFRGINEGIFHAKLIFHNKDSLYFKNRIIIAYHDIEWFYLHSFASDLSKLIGVSGLLSSLPLVANDYNSGNMILGCMLFSLSWLILHNSNETVFLNSEWKLVIPERKNETYHQWDLHPELIGEPWVK